MASCFTNFSAYCIFKLNLLVDPAITISEHLTTEKFHIPLSYLETKAGYRSQKLPDGLWLGLQ